MEMLGAVAIGYLIGSIPTAGWLGRMWKVDLRREGSGNPGTANALSTGGPALAATVLLVEMAKGAGAAAMGSALADGPGLVAAGLAVAAGNLYNVWYLFAGGKGLGITAGVLLVGWPWVLPVVVAVIGISAWATKSSGGATIIAIAFLAASAVLWGPLGLPEGWGIDSGLLPFLGIGLGLLILPKHLESARFRRSRASASPARR